MARREVLPAIANSLFLASCLREARAFHRSLGDVGGTQERLLLATLGRNARTEYGRAFGFGGLRTVEEYRERVPLSAYEDYAGAIERIGLGEADVLTRDPVLLMEPTSGSTAATKLIPYTASLRSEFGRGVAAWVAGVFLHDPRLMQGPAYWSVSPLPRAGERTAGGIPIGFDDDAAYLGRGRGALVRSAMAVPAEVRHVEDVELFRYLTLLFLLRARTLTLVSVWNPTFLTLLLSRLPAWRERLVHDLARGTLPPEVPAPLRATLAHSTRPDPRRAGEVRRAFEEEPEIGDVHSRLWPRLRHLSMWTGGHAALHAPEAARLLPQARVRGKGLISTECFATFPLAGGEPEAALLAFRSHFFEFIPQEEAGRRMSGTLLAPELTAGGRYELVVTTGGGLYRYRTSDVVEVVGWIRACPLLRFLGKSDLVSDRFGEKLNERHVRESLVPLLSRHAPDSSFAMLAYEADLRSYTVFVEAPDASRGRLRHLGTELESTLRESYHYDYCRRLGQLGALEVFWVRRGAIETYTEVCRAWGQSAGDVKPVALHQAQDWSKRFDGEFLRVPA